MSKRSMDPSRRDGFHREEDVAADAASQGMSQGMTEEFLDRSSAGAQGPLDPLDRRFGGVDPAVVGEKVVFRLWADGLVSGRAIEQARAGGDQRLRLDQRLVRLHLIDEEEAAHALAAELEAPEAVEEDFPEEPVLADLLPRRFVEEALALPLSDDGAVLTLAMADPIDDYAQRAIAMKTRRQLDVLVAAPSRIRAAIARLYSPNAGRPRRAAAAQRPQPRRETQPQDHPQDAVWQAPQDSFRARAPRPAAPAQVERTRQALESYSLVPAELEHFDEPEPFAPHDEPEIVPEQLASRLVSPSFVRPKRVMRKNRVAPAHRRAEPLHAEPSSQDAADGSRRPARRERRFVGGFVDSFIAADPVMTDFDRDWLGDVEEDLPAPARPSPQSRERALAEKRARRQQASRAAERRSAASPPAERASAEPAPARPPRRRVDEAARRQALTEVRRSLRAQAALGDDGLNGARTNQSRTNQTRTNQTRTNGAQATAAAPSDAAARHAARQAFGGEEIRRDGPRSGGVRAPFADRPLSMDDERPLYQAARAVADREARASASRIAADSVLRHKLVDAPLGDGRASAGADRAAAKGVDPHAATRKPAALGEVAADDVDPSALEAIRAAMAGGDGMILLAGPAGSAKLASLRALAREAAGAEGEIYRLDRPEDRARLAQTGGRRVALGDIRDAESAETAVRLAMTGGLVFASIEASTASAAPERLIQLGVPAYALASSLRVIATQALFEKGCLRCAQTGRSVSGESCNECGGLGVERRAALTEAASLDDTIRALILAGAPEAALRHAMERPPEETKTRRPKRDRRAARRIASAAMSGAYGFGAP